MKRNEWMALIVTSFMMMAVCLSAQAKVKKTVERGMTKQEVIAIMGQPKLTSFDAYGDKWEYYKMNVISGESKRIVVGFDLNGRVVAYETKFWDNNTNSEIGNCNQRIYYGLEFLIISPAFDFSLSNVNTLYMSVAFCGSTIWGAMSRSTFSCASPNVNIFIMRAVWLHE